MTKLVKTSGEIAPAGSDFAEKLTRAFDPCMAKFAEVGCDREAGHVGLHHNDERNMDWAGPKTVAIDTETFEWDSKKRFDDREQARTANFGVDFAALARRAVERTTNERRKLEKMFNFGVGTGMGPKDLSKKLNITVEEAEKLRKEFDEKFPGAKEALDMLARNGVTFDQQKVDALARRVSGDFANMRRAISDEWARVFLDESSREAARSVASAVAATAVDQAMKFGVPSDAETKISPCGCVWALQTTFSDGSGDIILRTCAVHAIKKKQ